MGFLAKFQQQRTDALLGVLGEVFATRMLQVNRRGDRRSWTALMRYFLRENGQRAEKGKRPEPSKGRKPLDGADIVRDGRFSGDH